MSGGGGAGDGDSWRGKSFHIHRYTGCRYRQALVRYGLQFVGPGKRRIGEQSRTLRIKDTTFKVEGTTAEATTVLQAQEERVKALTAIDKDEKEVVDNVARSTERLVI